MTVYYNEFEPFAAEWLRNLSAAGHISRGEVDERSIREVCAADVQAATRAHFFAGVGVWDAALRDAGWPDWLPVWTGSCPCQPFSAAGARGGFADERHLWPSWCRLVRELRPPAIFGEQVASPDGLRWFDAVRADLEAEDYAVGCADLSAAGVGAPHARQRLFFFAVADASRGGRAWLHAQLQQRQPRHARAEADRRGAAGGVGHADGERGGRVGGGARREEARGQGGGEADRRERDLAVDPGAAVRVADAEVERRAAGRDGGAGARRDARGVEPERHGDARGFVADPDGPRRGPREHDGDGPPPWLRGSRGVADAGAGGRAVDARDLPPWGREPDAARGGSRSVADPDVALAVDRRLPRGGRVGEPAEDSTAGFWRGAEWIPCADGKARPVEPGTFPLVDGAAGRVVLVRAGEDGQGDRSRAYNRVGALRGYGNAIVRPLAAAFIQAAMGALT